MGLADALKSAHRKTVDLVCGEPVVFHHVPKCGGTSVGRALRMRYLPSQTTIDPEASFRAVTAIHPDASWTEQMTAVRGVREQMLLYHLHQEVRCVAGHVAFSEPAFDRYHDQYKFITILREPVSRFISNYFWSHGRYQRLGREGAHAGIPEEFDAFLETGHARLLGASFVDFYCGMPVGSDFTSPLAVERAMENLNCFDVVGFLDDLPAFEAQLKQTLGVRIRIGHENKGREQTGARESVVTDAHLERIQKLCAPDIAVWQAAQSLRKTAA